MGSKAFSNYSNSACLSLFLTLYIFKFYTNTRRFLLKYIIYFGLLIFWPKCCHSNYKNYVPLLPKRDYPSNINISFFQLSINLTPMPFDLISNLTIQEVAFTEYSISFICISKKISMFSWISSNSKVRI